MSFELMHDAFKHRLPQFFMEGIANTYDFVGHLRQTRGHERQAGVAWKTDHHLRLVFEGLLRGPADVFGAHRLTMQVF